MRIGRISLVCDDLEAMAAFWRDSLGLIGRDGVDPLHPERRLLIIDLGTDASLEYVWFPGLPGDRGSGDLRRLEFSDPDPGVWQRLQGVAQSLPLPGAPLAVLEPTGVLLVFWPPTGDDVAGHNP